MNENTREELLELLNRSSPRARKTIIRALGGKADTDNLAFVKETLDFVQPDQTVRSVEFLDSRTCSSGHLQDDKTRFVSIAQCCGAVTCSVEGCSLNCRCGKSLCRRHAHLVAGQPYCSRCFLGGLLRYVIFGPENKEGKE